jgi:pimeloyl-ACP methyl ester carboxylesterase
MNTNHRFDKIAFFCVVDIEELLWISVNQGKPAALHLHHDPMPFFENVRNIIKGIFYFGNLFGYKWLGDGEIVAYQFRDNLPNAKLLMLQECGHVPMMEKPDEFNSALEQFFC